MKKTPTPIGKIKKEEKCKCPIIPLWPVMRHAMNCPNFVPSQPVKPSLTPEPTEYRFGTPRDHHDCPAEFPSWETESDKNRSVNWCYGCGRTWYKDTGIEAHLHDRQPPTEEQSVTPQEAYKRRMEAHIKLKDRIEKRRAESTEEKECYGICANPKGNCQCLITPSIQPREKKELKVCERHVNYCCSDTPPQQIDCNTHKPCKDQPNGKCSVHAQQRGNHASGGGGGKGAGGNGAIPTSHARGGPGYKQIENGECTSSVQVRHDDKDKSVQDREPFTISDPDAGISFDIHPDGVPLDRGMDWAERFDIFYKNLWDEWENNSTSLSFEVWREDQVRDHCLQSVFQARTQAFTEAIGVFERIANYDIGAIPETNDYANGWNDARKEVYQIIKKPLKEAINSLSGRTK